MNEPTCHSTPEETKTALEIAKLRLEISALSKPSQPLWKRLLSKFPENFVGALIALVISVLAIWPNILIDRIKEKLNQADLRFAHLNQISEDLSEFAFNAEVVNEYFDKNWTTKRSLEAIVDDYNKSVTAVRKREKLYYAILNKYWEPPIIEKFTSLMRENIKPVDLTIRQLTPEAELVISGSQPKVRPQEVAIILKQLDPKVAELSKKTTEFLDALNK
jgi:hypothetical protein